MAVKFDWSKPCGGDEAQKSAFHKNAKAAMRRLAKELKLVDGSYDIRSNQGGVAVSGEITLHHEQVYVVAQQSAMGADMGVLIRTCKGRRDSTGGPNNFAPLSMLDDIPALAGRVKQIYLPRNDDEDAAPSPSMR